MNKEWEWLGEQVEKWKNEEIINEKQAQRILSKYERAETVVGLKEESSSNLISVVSVLGGILVGVGAILFIASNWKYIPDFLKLILLFGTTYATYFAGWKLKYHTKTHPKLGNTLLFLGSILVGVTIFLTAQIFNVNANAHWLVLLWFLAISPFGYAFNSKYILGLNISTFALWIILYVSSTKGLLTTFETFMLYLLFGISLYGIGQFHHKIEKYSHFRISYQGVGLLFILTSFFFFSLETPYREFYRVSTTNWTVQLLFFIFGIISLASVIGSTSDKFKTIKHEFYVLLLAFSGWIITWLFLFFKDDFIISTVTKYGYTHTQLDPTISTILFIVFNLILFILSIGSILIGYHKTIIPFVNLGMAFFVLGILHLYFTTLYELLPRSLAFITGGLVLIGAGYYLENKRRSLIKEMENRHG